MERIEKTQASSSRVDDASPAVGLLDDLSELERQLLTLMAPTLNVASLQPLEWDSASTTVWIPHWKKFVMQFSKFVENQTIDTIAESCKNLAGMGSRIPDPPGMLLTREQRAQRAFELLWKALAVTLPDHGWTPQIQPGEFFFSKGDARITPTDSLEAMVAGKTSVDEWREWCNLHEMTGVLLFPTAGASRAAC